MVNRRGFLSTLAAVAAGAVLDPERLLWVPGSRTIFLPPVERLQEPTPYGLGPAGPDLLQGALKLGDIFTIAGVYVPRTRTLQQFVAGKGNCVDRLPITLK